MKRVECRGKVWTMTNRNFKRLKMLVETNRDYALAAFGKPAPLALTRKSKHHYEAMVRPNGSGDCAPTLARVTRGYVCCWYVSMAGDPDRWFLTLTGAQQYLGRVYEKVD